MKRNDEKAYYAYLERMIREQKASSAFWQKDSTSYEMDILMLLNHISRRNPDLLNKIVDSFVDTTGMKDCSKQDILSFMARTEKGTVCKWKDENGEEIYLINNGERFLRKSKQILVFGSHLNRGDLDLLKKSMYGQVLRRDIQKVYEKIAREEQRKEINNASNKKKSFLESLAEKREHKLEHTASDFEKNFKELVKEQGSLCIPQATAQTMLSFMDNAEKRRLSESFSQLGVRSSLDLERLLDRWKAEALNPEIVNERTYARTVKTRNVEVSHTR